MPNVRDLFHKVSYLQYPLMFIALYYSFKPYVVGFDSIWENYNFMLIFAGLGVGLSTLQDTTKTQNKISKRIWENPTKGKLALVMIALMALFLIITGLFGIYAANNEILQQIAIGTIVFGSIASMAILMLNGVVITPPDGADTSTMEGLILAMPLMEPKHFLMPFLAHALGTLVGAWIAARVAPTNKMAFALAIGAFFMIGGAYMVMSLPSPLWFSAADLGLAYFPMAYLGGMLAIKKEQPKVESSQP